MKLHTQPVTAPLRGELMPPGDKSISHRSLIFGCLASGETRVYAKDNAPLTRVRFAIGFR